MIRIIILISMFFLKVFAKEAHSSFLNPLTDICWKCLFPIHISGVNVTPAQKDWATYSLHPLCSCSGFPPKVGIPLAFWEPTGLVDVTRIPYQLKAWGGIQISEPGIKKRGTVSNNGDSGRTSFYNVHYYHFPVLHWANVLTSFSCLDKSEVSISYMSELDPFWDDDQWASVLNPEIYLFANPLAQSACIGDCTLSSMDKPNDKLFWCAGCSGTLYPFVGYVPHHVGAVQASYLLVQRLLAKLPQL